MVVNGKSGFNLVLGSNNVVLKPYVLLPWRFLAVLDYNLEQKIGGKFTKLCKIGFSMECFTADLLQFFCQKTSKFCFWVDGWVLAIKPKNFRDFLEIS